MASGSTLDANPDERIEELPVAGLTVVVGAAQGIGEEVARHLATTPWTSEVVLADLNLPAARLVAEDLRQSGHDARAVHVDVRDPASIAALANETAAGLEHGLDHDIEKGSTRHRRGIPVG